MYQGKNTENIEIDPSLQNLLTAQKYVSNYIFKSGISNDPHGSIHIYIDNQYAVTQLFALVKINYNLRAVGTCRANRKVFEN